MVPTQRYYKEADECVDSLKQIRSQIEEVASLLSQSENNQTIQTMQVMKTETVSKLNCVVSKLAKIQKRTSEATKTSIGTVKNIANQGKSSDLLITFRTPGKKRPRAKPVTNIDNFDQDQILAEANHSILRLPPYHPDLNPIEMAWATSKQYVASKNVKWNLQECTKLIKEKVSLMGAQEWGKICKKVKDIEEEYVKSDHVVDLLTEQFIIRVDDSSEDDDSDDGYEDDDDDNCNRGSP
ncbi:uncharacterized protein LOC120624314 [Pararge aegeria]|uniref:uncharacterized protein LOC120624314 n=1 Tax=Pararge aegeria TaxID=116150 RepID=UPI0019D043C7|nr:uncharacterized protein LOC120624314 [Pararge aegeria]